MNLPSLIDEVRCLHIKSIPGDDVLHLATLKHPSFDVAKISLFSNPNLECRLIGEGMSGHESVLLDEVD